MWAVLPHHHGLVLGHYCPRVSSEITLEVILCKYSRQLCKAACAKLQRRARARQCFTRQAGHSPDALRNTPSETACLSYGWAEAPIKIARMTLTIKLDGNWSSFQLANNTPPLSVTGSVIAPSARMLLASALCDQGAGTRAWQ
jgi:hypothetical protein